MARRGPPSTAAARLRRLVVVCVVPIAVGVAATSLRRAQGPFWLATNQDPAYSYLYDSLRVARGLPPNHIQHPGTFVQIVGAVLFRGLRPGGSGVLERTVLSDPEPFLAALHAVLLGAALIALAAFGAAVLRVTSSPWLCWLGQVGPFMIPGTILELAGAKPEPLLLALSLTLAALIVRHAGAERPAFPSLLLGAVAGLALATKFTALPLWLLPLLVMQGARTRLRFIASAVVTFLGATAPILSRLPESIGFVWRSATGRGMYGTGLLASAYGPAVHRVLAESAPYLAVAVISLASAVARRPPVLARRILVGTTAVQLAGLAGALLQPWGGLRYLLPTAGILGLSLVLLAWIWAVNGQSIRAPAIAGFLIVALFAGHEGWSLWARVRTSRWLARQQQEAAKVGQGAASCGVVQYHRASSIPSALLFGYGRPEIDGGDLQLLWSFYPSAVFLDYVRDTDAGGPSSFRFLPYESWTRPRFRDFRGRLALDDFRAGRPCVVFQGSTPGPGRLFRFGEFARESIPLRGAVTPLYSSPTEAVYRLDLDEGRGLPPL